MVIDIGAWKIATVRRAQEQARASYEVLVAKRDQLQAEWDAMVDRGDDVTEAMALKYADTIARAQDTIALAQDALNDYDKLWN